MKYHKREKIYCLSEEDYIHLIMDNKELQYDSELKNYFWFLETVEETGPNFFKITKEDLLKTYKLGYTGKNDVRDIIDWFEFEYSLSYSVNHKRRYLEAFIVIDGLEYSNLLSIQIAAVDERSKYDLMKLIVNEFLLLFNIENEKILGPSFNIFEKRIKGKLENDIWI